MNNTGLLETPTRIVPPVGDIFRGPRCAEVRKAAGFTQQEVADKFKKTQGAYGHWEKDRALPNVDELYKLADLFGVSADVFRQTEGTPIKWLPGRKPKMKSD